MDDQTFAEVLRKLRKRAGLTQEELAAKIGLKGRKLVGRYESSQKQSLPSEATLRRMVDVFIDIGELGDFIPADNSSHTADLENFCRLAHFAIYDVVAQSETISYKLSRLPAALETEEQSGNTNAEEAKKAVSPIGAQVQELSNQVRTFAPTWRHEVQVLDNQVARLSQAGATPEEAGALLGELNSELDRSQLDAERFQICFLRGRVFEFMADYRGAYTAYLQATDVGKAISYNAPLSFRAALADVYDSMGRSILLVGEKDNFRSASVWFEQALQERKYVKNQLELLDIQSGLELARARTSTKNRNQLKQAERLYRDLIKRCPKNSMLRAHTYKELADNCRFADRLDRMRDNFSLALQEYESVAAQRHEDTIVPIECQLNIGYCHRRLEEEPRAVDHFQSALKASRELRDRRRVAYSCLQLARSPLVQEELHTALTYAIAARDLFAAADAQADMREAEILIGRFEPLLGAAAISQATSYASRLTAGL